MKLKLKLKVYCGTVIMVSQALRELSAKSRSQYWKMRCFAAVHLGPCAMRLIKVRCLCGRLAQGQEAKASGGLASSCECSEFRSFGV